MGWLERSFDANSFIRYGIGPHIQYSSEIKEIHWDDDKGLWNVHMHVQGKPEIKQFELIFNSCGVFTDPYTPEIEGISTFKGKQVHASAWDIEAASLVGKNVCLVGTGPTAIQIVPEIAHMVKKLTIFSRTPNWIIPMDNEPFSPAQLNEFRTNPDKLRAYRQALMDQTEKMWLLVSVPGSSTAKKIQQYVLSILCCLVG